MMRFLAREDLKGLLQMLGEEAQLIAPTSSDGVVLFRPIDDPDEVTLEYVNTVTSAKDFLFPQDEDILRFESGDDGGLAIDGIRPVEKRVLFGVRPCDAKGIDLLDEVFLTGQFRDDHYQDRRNNTVVVSMACQEVADECFCTAVGLNPGATDGSDVMLYPYQGGFVVVPVSHRGEAAVDTWQGLLTDIDSETAQGAVQEYQEKSTPLGEAVDFSGITDSLATMFESPVWEDLARRCLGCGVCTYVCPTCHCFGLSDEARGSQGYRLRCWDSCMFSDFTEMAGGHNPRPTKTERVRQRFMHKLNYHPNRYGQLLCTGCGRCVEKCPVGLHIVDAVLKIKAAQVEAAQAQTGEVSG